jgi:hypothetical protein
MLSLTTVPNQPNSINIRIVIPRPITGAPQLISCIRLAKPTKVVDIPIDPITGQ